jgi:hypothetical protein
MPEFGEKYREKAQQITAKVSSAVFRYTARSKKLAKSLLYWSSVATIGLTLSAVIADVGFGVEIFSITNAANGAGKVIATILGNILYYGVFGVVLLAAFVMSYILEIVLLYPYGDPSIFPAWSGNGFVNVDQVVVGWKLVRDICNIFFSLILVVIAMASVLKIEAYSWKQLMPKFFIAAILINFSKSIAGIFTDFATIAMATFGSSFQGSFARGLIGGFGLPVLGDFAQGTENDPNRNGSGTASILFAYVAAGAMAAIFFILMSVFAATLIFRIIMLWFLIVLSPLAYITRILPLTQRYSSQWWEMFGRYVVVGPLVTFFLWLSLTMAFGGQSSTAAAGETTIGRGFNSTNPLAAGINEGTSQVASSRGVTQPPAVGNFQSTNPNVLANFMIATLMLLASLKLISQMAQEFGKFTGMIEQQAGGVMSRAVEKMGQSGIMIGSKMGRQPKKDADGNITERGSGSYYIGQSLSALSSTIGQPLSFAKSVVENIGKSSEAKQKAARNQAMRNASVLRNEQVMGRSDTGGMLIGSLANMTGTLAGAGMADGKVVFDNYLSGSGVWRGIKKGARVRRDMRLAKEKGEEAERIGREVEKEKTRLSETEAPIAASRYEDVRDKAKRLESALGDKDAATGILGTDALDGDDNLNETALNGLTLDATQEVVKQIIADRIDKLTDEQKHYESVGKSNVANDIGEQIHLLQEASANGSQIEMGDFIAEFSGAVSEGHITDPQAIQQQYQAVKKDIDNAYKGEYEDVKNEQGDRKKRLRATGYEFDGAGAITTTGTRYRKSQKAIEAMEKQQYIAQNQSGVIQMELAALAGDDGYETHRSEQEAMGEAMKSLDGIFQSNQLIERFFQARRQGDNYGMKAAITRLSQNGDLNELTQRLMSVDGEGNFDEKAGTSAEAVWHTIDTLMDKSDDRMKRELYDSLLSSAADKGQFDRAFGSYYLGNQIRIPDAQKRKEVAIGQGAKLGARKLAQSGRFAFITEDARGNAQFKEGAGEELLKRNSGAYATPHGFRDLDPTTKEILARPENIAYMRSAGGFNSDFIRNLEQWRRAQGVKDPLR